MSSLLIGLIFASSFFIESIIGFGGTLIAFSILGFFVDIKELILIAVYIGTVAAVFIIASDYKSFKKEVFFQSFFYCLIGTIIGIVLFVHISSAILTKLFGGFLVILSIKTFFFDNIKFPKILVNKILIIGGISQGIFGIGGPFLVTVLKDRFAYKAQLRATFAAFFIVFNFIRYAKLSVLGEFNYDLFFDFWWTPFPLIIAIYYGHQVHIKISDKIFKNVIAALTLFSGISFFFK